MKPSGVFFFYFVGLALFCIFLVIVNEYALAVAAGFIAMLALSHFTRTSIREELHPNVLRPEVAEVEINRQPIGS